MQPVIGEKARRILRSARVGHLATADRTGRPHVVPAVFALDGDTLYTPIDGKPKKHANRLRRLRNLSENPSVAFLVDRYEEDWSRLGYVLVRGTAKVLRAEDPHRQGEEKEFQKAEAMLRSKYPQYESVPLGGPSGLIIRIDAERCVLWGHLW